MFRSERRRLARSPGDRPVPIADDNRVTAGCVVVPPAFYAAVVQPVRGRTRGVVHILAETQPDSTS